MKSKYFSHCILISLISLNACAQTQSWNGIYTYEANIGENAVEDKMLIEYIFTLNGEKCLITSQGYQTDEKIRCVADRTKGNLVVKFLSYENGSTKNIYDVEVYAPQSTLFTLESKNSTLITIWGTLVPDESFTTGNYFTKEEM